MCVCVCVCVCVAKIMLHKVRQGGFVAPMFAIYTVHMVEARFFVRQSPVAVHDRKGRLCEVCFVSLLHGCGEVKKSLDNFSVGS